MLNIEKGIEAPDRRVYPYAEMEVNDSFLVTDAKMQTVCNANYRAYKRLGWKFICRKEGEGIRVWRVS